MTDITPVRIILSPAQRKVVQRVLDEWDIMTFFGPLDDARVKPNLPPPLLDGDVLVVHRGDVLDNLFYLCCTEYAKKINSRGRSYPPPERRVLKNLSLMFRRAGAQAR